MSGASTRRRPPTEPGDALLHTLERRTWLPRRIEQVFEFFADAGNLERITPPELRFRIVTERPIVMRPGTLIDYRLSLFGIPFDWHTEITGWQPPHRFVDTQLAGPYWRWIHQHEFTDERGGTRMLDRVEYVLPLGRLGLVAKPLVRRQLDRIFDYREQAIQRLLA